MAELLPPPPGKDSPDVWSGKEGLHEPLHVVPVVRRTKKPIDCEKEV